MCSRAAARRAHDADHVVERREELRREIGADDARVLVECHLTRHVQSTPGCAEYAVGVAARLREVGRVDELLHGLRPTFTPEGRPAPGGPTYGSTETV